MTDTKGSDLTHASTLSLTDLVLLVTTPGAVPDTEVATIALLILTMTGSVEGTLASGADPRIVGAAQVADLGDLAYADFGTEEGTAAQGNDPRIVSAAQYNYASFYNTDYVANFFDRFIAQESLLTASRTVTLPAANAVGAGETIVVADKSVTCNGSNTIIIVPTGADTVNLTTSATINVAGGEIAFTSNGVDNWAYDAGVVRAYFSDLKQAKGATFSNADYTVPSYSRFAAQNGVMTAARTVTLPAASAISFNQDIVIADISGSVTATNKIIIQASGSDKINGSLNGATTVEIKAGYGRVVLTSNGANGYFYNSGSLRPTLGKKLLGNMSNVWTKHFKSFPDTGRTAYTSTYNLITKAPCSEYFEVRLVYKNGEATAVNIAGACVAPTASNASRITPTVGSGLTNDGGLTGWQRVTFAGANGVSIPAGTANNPTVMMSDWVACNSIPCTDATGKPYVMARTKFVESGTYTSTYFGTANNTPTEETYARCDSQVGDFVTAPASFTTQNGEVNSPLFGLEFKSSMPTVRVLCIGSSTMQGVGGTPVDSLYRSWVPIAQELLSAAGVPVSLFNYAYSGHTTALYTALGKQALLAHQPSICIYLGFSTNDGTPTQAIVDAMFARGMGFAEFAAKNNCITMFAFTAPKNAYDATADGFRKSLIARYKASGYPCIDMTSAVGDGASPERYQLAYDSGDGIHPNQAGYTVMAPITANAIIDLLIRNFDF